ncbi:hypothetical protein [Acanthamoeba castellanii mimivirus]|uniref:Uncharacterized protein R800 n=5 Tax=Mimivirus TaxID=315393 RepID=YR800_MIMIV|nr:hypothetical protein MIMI_gp0863 [Acanthamoeba polyphaga mimivirus]Q5UR62.1 RecName: Full=Uncharacterized protein R800 [Acanthamoeba polyphaga mimivirus]AEQ61015.1 hypothetical protein [Acanthamoeba castellanii mamavirus]AHA45028.1 hypothetical protein HIRU_S122 [Hirudovirus strain Sangsue]AHJ40388.1 hypothetical protein [Samba virus]ALR84448.1 hypothetical protein [Niemeyer virus]AMZ03242.1 hypothetical protein [Mimivirus Bombay]BAV61938.1 hypothetical protein [Acanthamoeba castellanii m
MDNMDEIIKEAVIYKRLAHGIYGQLGGDHYAVQVTTISGKKFIIHSTPEHGTVITDVTLSNKWTLVERIKITNQKTVKKLFKEISGKTTIKFVNYVTSGTCIGTTQHIKHKLTK